MFAIIIIAGIIGLAVLLTHAGHEIRDYRERREKEKRSNDRGGKV